MPLSEKAQKFYKDNFANKPVGKEKFDVKNLRKAVEKSFNNWLSDVSIPKTINVSNECLEFGKHTIKATIYIN